MLLPNSFFGFRICCPHPNRRLFSQRIISILQFPYSDCLEKKELDPSFFAFVFSFAAFSNSGLVFRNDNMVLFCESAPLLLSIIILNLVRNTMFPPYMRAIIWLLHRKSAEANKKAVYGYLLRHPRKCYMHLFPNDKTKWLVVTVVGFTTVFTTRNAGENVMNLSDLSAPMLLYIGMM
ncbi:hypothetical protein O6H91_06G003600 [Diphasiastrum complanatum]|uniref:Uncharacterized protein n=1 Tax=Diphasiastrum complanatum TaxID=34168 RepID=A0ACC2DAN9_DIPCM|nr:hypothetical protein O6H91_06G003600 [Diphasiastrum complanatum]